MPVKIRCTGCEKVLTAPDKARGKAIKCPQCQTKLRVPAAKKQAAAAKAPDSEHFLATLDLNRVEDSSANVCPRCGTDVPDEEFECPGCGVDIRTGQLSESARRKRERKGPDPAEFYRTVWGDAWRFLTKHWTLAARTAAYLLAFTLAYYACGFMMLWCSKLPLKVFWGALTFLAAMAIPGWLWFLNIEIIRRTMTRTTKFKDIRFDFFHCVALGIAAVFWLFVFGLPFFIVSGGIGAALFLSDMELAGGIVAAAGYLPVIVLLPIAMAHMCMPVTWPGWVSPKLLPIFFRTAGPALYWSLILLVTMIPTIALQATAGAVSGDDVDAFVTTLADNARIERAKEIVAEQKEPSEAVQELARLSTREVDFEPVILPAVLISLSFVTLGVAAVYNMRTNGLFVHYFRRDLDLITLSKEVTYVAKEKKVDEFGDPIPEGKALKLLAGLGGLLLFYIVANVIVYFATGGEYIILPRPLAEFLNLIE